jgi:hypothetical protein
MGTIVMKVYRLLLFGNSGVGRIHGHWVFLGSLEREVFLYISLELRGVDIFFVFHIPDLFFLEMYSVLAVL